MVEAEARGVLGGVLGVGARDEVEGRNCSVLARLCENLRSRLNEVREVVRLSELREGVNCLALVVDVGWRSCRWCQKSS